MDLCSQLLIMQVTAEYIHIGIFKISELMHQYTNPKHHSFEIQGGIHTWLSIDHLELPAKRSRKPASKFLGLYHIVPAIGLFAFCLELPAEWEMHDTFYES